MKPASLLLFLMFVSTCLFAQRPKKASFDSSFFRQQIDYLLKESKSDFRSIQGTQKEDRQRFESKYQIQGTSANYLVLTILESEYHAVLGASLDEPAANELMKTWHGRLRSAFPDKAKNLGFAPAEIALSLEDRYYLKLVRTKTGAAYDVTLRLVKPASFVDFSY